MEYSNKDQFIGKLNYDQEKLKEQLDLSQQIINSNNLQIEK